MLRRHSVDAGDSWRKFTDPAWAIDQDYERRYRRNRAVAFWVWMIAVGAWLGLAVSVLR